LRISTAVLGGHGPRKIRMAQAAASAILRLEDSKRTLAELLMALEAVERNREDLAAVWGIEKTNQILTEASASVEAAARVVEALDAEIRT